MTKAYDRFEVIESRRWKNLVTGATASIYGSHPSCSDADDKNWAIESCGWTIRDNQAGTVGCGRLPWKTKEEAQAVAYRWNREAAEYAEACRKAVSA